MTETFKCGHEKTLANTYYLANNRTKCARCYGSYDPSPPAPDMTVDVADYFNLPPEERLRRAAENGT